MKIFIALVIIALVLGIGMAGAEQINPKTDVLLINSDGEYVKIFGADNFPYPLQIINGIAYIGSMVNPLPLGA